MRKPLISVIMSIYNDGEYVSESIKSILSQSHQDFEFIIVNDGSTDNSEDIINSFRDKRIRYLKNPENIGLARSLNLALANSEGKYVARMDADDISVPERLANQLDFMEQYPEVGIVGSWVQQFGQAENTVRYSTSDFDIRIRMLSDSPFAHPSVMIRREVLGKHQLQYDPNFRTAQDYDLWSRMARYTNMAILPKVLLHSRVHENQVTSRKKADQAANRAKVAKSLFQYLGIGEDNEIQFLQDLLGNKYVLSVEFLVEAERIMKMLINNNLKIRYFDQELLYAFLCDRWKSLTWGSTKLGIKFYFLFIRSEFSQVNKLSYPFHVKFISKCLLRM